MARMYMAINHYFWILARDKSPFPGLQIGFSGFTSHFTVANAGLFYCKLNTDIVHKICHAQEDAGPTNNINSGKFPVEALLAKQRSSIW